LKFQIYVYYIIEISNSIILYLLIAKAKELKDLLGDNDIGIIDDRVVTKVNNY
jgi:hypothetical protein